jgi:hypothetical protein
MLTHPRLEPAKLPAKRTATTPLGFAKLLARNHPDFVGIAFITTLTPAGKDGHKIKPKKTTFLISGGLAAQRGEHRDPAKTRRYWRNGTCECCGRLFLEKLLTIAIAPDGWIMCCVNCSLVHHLRLDPNAADWRAVRFERPHSRLAAHSDEQLPKLQFNATKLHALATAPDDIRGRVIPNVVETEGASSGAVSSGA